MKTRGIYLLTSVQVNSTEDWFYQIKGSMLLRLIEDNQIRHVTSREGEMFLVDGESARIPLSSFVMRS